VSRITRHRRLIGDRTFDGIGRTTRELIDLFDTPDLPDPRCPSMLWQERPFPIGDIVGLRVELSNLEFVPLRGRGKRRVRPRTHELGRHRAASAAPGRVLVGEIHAPAPIVRD